MFDYETCRWCKYYDKGICIKLSENVESNEMNLEHFIEKGFLSETIKESFGDKEPSYKLIEELCDSIETVLRNKLKLQSNFIPPEYNFKCKFFE